MPFTVRYFLLECGDFAQVFFFFFCLVLKETKSATMNIFRNFFILFLKSFLKDRIKLCFNNKSVQYS